MHIFRIAAMNPAGKKKKMEKRGTDEKSQNKGKIKRKYKMENSRIQIPIKK